MSSDSLFSVDGKVIIVTGGGRGIGGFLARALADRGALVCSFDIRHETPERNSEGSIREFEVDVTSQPSVMNACREVVSEFEKIDVLINNAGVTEPVLEGQRYPDESWSKTLEVNLTGAFVCCREVLPFMKARAQGSVINITSINAELAFPNNPAYVASKGGLKMLGKSLASDWGRYGIRVNNLGPGYIRTDMTTKSYDNETTRSEREQRTLLGRWGTLDDLVGPCVFLASDASQYVTGLDLYVDGGWLAKGL